MKKIPTKFEYNENEAIMYRLMCGCKMCKEIQKLKDKEKNDKI